MLEVRTTEGYEEAFRNLGDNRRTGIVQLGSPALTVPAARLGDAALKYGFPTISFYTPHAKASALLSYGPNLEIYFHPLRYWLTKSSTGPSPATFQSSNRTVSS
jgi:hypothetical protein